MANLRALAVADLKRENIADWGLPVEFVGPDGTEYTTDNETGDPLTAVQVLYDYTKFDPETGEDIIVYNPVVVMSRSSLAVIPAPGENWQIRFPLDPSNPDVLAEDYLYTEDRATESVDSLGFIRFYPIKAGQS